MIKLPYKTFTKLRKEGLLYMKKLKKLIAFILLISLLLIPTACSKIGVTEKSIEKPIILQGAMDIETDFMMDALEDSEEFTLGGYKFLAGKLEGYPVIVCKTQVGMVNAATATTLAIQELNPLVIINQGTMGGHDKTLHRGDIVLGRETANINSFKSDWKDIGQGMDPASWQWRKTEVNLNGNEFEDVSVLNIDNHYLSIADSIKDTYTGGKVVKGLIAS